MNKNDNNKEVVTRIANETISFVQQTFDNREHALSLVREDLSKISADLIERFKDRFPSAVINLKLFNAQELEITFATGSEENWIAFLIGEDGSIMPDAFQWEGFVSNFQSHLEDTEELLVEHKERLERLHRFWKVYWKLRGDR